jgi:hypothetical protein
MVKLALHLENDAAARVFLDGPSVLGSIVASPGTPGFVGAQANGAGDGGPG